MGRNEQSRCRFPRGGYCVAQGVVLVAGGELESDGGLWRSGNDFRGWRPLDKGVFFVGEPWPRRLRGRLGVANGLTGLFEREDGDVVLKEFERDTPVLDVR